MADAPSPAALARKLQREGKGLTGSPARLVLDWCHQQRVGMALALAMGTHSRLGEESGMLLLSGAPELLQMIMSWVSPAPDDELAVSR